MPVDLRTRRQIASASNSGSRIAFGGNGSGGGNIVPSLPVTVEDGEDGLVTEEDIVVREEGAVESGAFGDAVDAVADGLRTIRALGGMASVVVKGSDGGRNPFRLGCPRQPMLSTRFPLLPSSFPNAHSAVRWT